jgi:hypothetical protein
VASPNAGSDCPTGKVQYTRAGARSARDSMRTHHGDAEGLKVFHCQLCDCWHIGNKQSRARRKATVRRG